MVTGPDDGGLARPGTPSRSRTTRALRAGFSLIAWRRISTGSCRSVAWLVFDAAASTFGEKRFASGQIEQVPRPMLHLYAVDPKQAEITALIRPRGRLDTVLP